MGQWILPSQDSLVMSMSSGELFRDYGPEALQVSRRLLNAQGRGTRSPADPIRRQPVKKLGFPQNGAVVAFNFPVTSPDSSMLSGLRITTEAPGDRSMDDPF